MKNFKITWEIELDAKNHKDAAITALGFMRRATSTALVFTVADTKTGETCEVDLWKKTSFVRFAKKKEFRLKPKYNGQQES